jgi:hypothetical protein
MARNLTTWTTIPSPRPPRSRTVAAMARKQGLTDKQQRFVEEYLVDLNATAAAGRAGYKGKYLDRIGSELLGKTRVAAAIAAAQAKRSKRTELNADYVLKRLRREANDHTPRAVPGARVKALELLGKHLAMWKEVGSRDNPLTTEFIETAAAAPDPARNGFHRPTGTEV